MVKQYLTYHYLGCTYSDHITPGQIIYQINHSKPVIIGYGPIGNNTIGHTVLVIGYRGSPPNTEFLVLDPATGARWYHDIDTLNNQLEMDNVLFGFCDQMYFPN